MPKIPKKASVPGRNRAQGWTYAKRSRHRHENDVAARLRSDLVFANGLSVRSFNEKLGRPVKVSGDGASAEHVEDFFGSGTNGKPELSIEWSAHHAVRISLKKSTGGHVFLISVARLVSGFEKQFEVEVSTKARTGIDLLIGGSESQLRNAVAGRRLRGPIHRRIGVTQEEHRTRLPEVPIEFYYFSA